MEQSFWFRELRAGGKGPDWLLNATFTPGSAGALATTLREHAPIGFGYYRAIQRPCSIHGGSCDYDLYIDSWNEQACIDQIEGRAAKNMYVYHIIQLCQHDYQMIRGYGGYPDQHGEAETRCIRALAQAPNIILAEWSIVYGGMTYPYETQIRGTTSGELLAYLDAQA